MLTPTTSPIIKLLCYYIFYNVYILTNIDIIVFFYVKMSYAGMTRIDNAI